MLWLIGAWRGIFRPRSGPEDDVSNLGDTEREGITAPL